ncbi:MAG: hypothetical protein AMJ81_10125 [Phycisphaerae bacterium SM23_33]|nr:MAG: hypothetical protein AMJ81_10125 [Phycisphaerae bacterium SM23_33]
MLEGLHLADQLLVHRFGGVLLRLGRAVRHLLEPQGPVSGCGPFPPAGRPQEKHEDGQQRQDRPQQPIRLARNEGRGPAGRAVDAAGHNHRILPRLREAAGPLGLRQGQQLVEQSGKTQPPPLTQVSRRPARQHDHQGPVLAGGQLLQLQPTRPAGAPPARGGKAPGPVPGLHKHALHDHELAPVGSRLFPEILHVGPVGLFHGLRPVRQHLRPAQQHAQRLRVQLPVAVADVGQDGPFGLRVGQGLLDRLGLFDGP